MEEEEDEEWRYIRGLYIKYDWELPLASKEVECKLDNLEKRLTTLNKYHSRYVGSNLTLNQHRICRDISDSQTHRDWQSDKNLGPVWCETELYTKRGVLDHLGNKATYKQLTENTAKSGMVKLRYYHEGFITRNRLEL